MGPIDALIHLVNFFMPAVGVALFAAVATKLMWRSELEGVSVRRLAAWASAAGSAALIGGLVVFGRDGKMATYFAMVAACAIGLMWAGWGRR